MKMLEEFRETVERKARETHATSFGSVQRDREIDRSRLISDL